MVAARMTDHLDQLIADIHELAALVGDQPRATKALQKASMRALCHAIQAERDGHAIPTQTGLLGDTPAAPLRVSEE
jgi:hypothetical protein